MVYSLVFFKDCGHGISPMFYFHIFRSLYKNSEIKKPSENKAVYSNCLQFFICMSLCCGL